MAGKENATVNLDLYRIFYTVAKCGSITKASEELFISQPAISQAIKQLEQQLGTTLFNRLHKGMVLSKQAGELVYPDVERALKLLSGVEGRLSALQSSATGTLRVGASETIFQYCLADRIVEFHEKFPQVKFELITDTSPNTMEHLKNDRCDVGFVNLPIEVDESVQLTDTVMMLNDIFIAGEAFADLKERELSIRELQEFPLLLMEPHMVARESFDRFCMSLGIKLVPTIEVDSWGFMKRLVVDGMGIGCIPREYALNKLRDGSLFEVKVKPALPTRSVGMALPRNGMMSYALRAFIGMLRER